jgi:hypothetical protein
MINYPAQNYSQPNLGSNPVLEKSLSMHNEILNQMTQFERTQQEQFERDLEEQRKILQLKQQEYKASL